jgi:hypothetical protein
MIRWRQKSQRESGRDADLVTGGDGGGPIASMDYPCRSWTSASRLAEGDGVDIVLIIVLSPSPVARPWTKQPQRCRLGSAAVLRGVVVAAG